MPPRIKKIKKEKGRFKKKGNRSLADMDFSNVKFDLNLNLNFGTTSGGYFDGLLQDLAVNQNRMRLNKIIEDRANKLSTISPSIADIHRRTERVEKNLSAGEKEFYTKRGKYIQKGSFYHIHYTKDLEVYYMTGGEHSPQTQLIFKSDIQRSDFDYYNTLNKQSTLRLESQATLPTEEDYNVGRMTRYFAKKTNESSSPAFEVSEGDFGSSPLYDYVSLTWYIGGSKKRVLILNRREVAIARITIPNIGKLLPNYQYYKSSVTVTTKQDIINRLGITGEQSTETQEPNTSTTTDTSPPPSSYNAGSTGPPPGVMTGGAGGGGSY